MKRLPLTRQVASACPCSAPRRTAARPFLDTRRSYASDTGGRTYTVAELLSWRPQPGAEHDSLQDVAVDGYVRATQRLKAGTFVRFGDGSTLTDLQAMVPTEIQETRLLRRAAAARLHGDLVPSQNPDVQTHELKVSRVDIVGGSDPKNFPIQRKPQTAQFLRGLPHLRSRLPVQTTILRLRSHAISILNNFFSKRGFIQTHPPIITSSDCEGAGEAFAIATEKARRRSKTTEGNVSREGQRQGEGVETLDSFFGEAMYLTVSTQLHLEALAQSLGNVWTLSPTFRAEKSDTSRHMAEFYMLEAEMTFVDDITIVMDLVEDMIRDLASNLRQNTVIFDEISAASQSKILEKHQLSTTEEVQARWDGLMAKPWPRITYTEAIWLLKEADGQFQHAVEWGLPLQAEHERFLADKVSASQFPGERRPVFVTHYPRDIKAFYMTQAPSPAPPRRGDVLPTTPGPTVACFDLLVPDLCEIVGGSMREHRLDELLLNMKAKGLVTPQQHRQGTGKNGLDWYVDLRRWGSPPHGGFGLGFDRLLAYLSGMQNVKDVVAFPRWWGRCEC